MRDMLPNGYDELLIGDGISQSRTLFTPASQMNSLSQRGHGVFLTVPAMLKKVWLADKTPLFNKAIPLDYITPMLLPTKPAWERDASLT